MPRPPRTVEITDNEVIVTVHYPRWDRLPENVKLTEQTLRQKLAENTWAEYWKQDRLRHLLYPQCAVAIPATEYGSGLWRPCEKETYGHPTCNMHGGPGSRERIIRRPPVGQQFT